MNDGSEQIGKTYSQLTKTVGSNVTGLFSKLKNGSLGEHFQSWIGKGENKPVTADQVTEALGNEHLAKIADQTGVSPQQAAQNIAKKVPDLVDKMTPDGQLPDPKTLQSQMSMAGGMSSPTGSRSTKR